VTNNPPNASDRKHIQATAIVSGIATAVAGVWSLVNIVDGRTPIAVQNMALTLCFLAAFLLNRSGRHTLAATATSTIFLAQMAFSTYAFGTASASHLFMLVGAVIPYLMFRRERIVLAHGFAAVSAVGFMASIVWQDSLPIRHVIVSVRFMAIFNSALVVIVLLAVAISFVAIVRRGEEALETAHRRANDLLLNVLPEAIAERLKVAPEKTIADRYDSVSVMFVDIAGFTETAEAQRPEETVAMLNRLFSEFDLVCERLGVEKIRTIGDGYMAVAGAPVAMADHPARIVEAGLAFLDIARRQGVDIRIGANCGELVAGIVGVRRFQYDIWGDTVNVAARMEAAGEVGRIHVSEAMARALGDRFDCVPRGVLEIKGKGEMKTWFVTGKAGRPAG